MKFSQLVVSLLLVLFTGCNNDTPATSETKSKSEQKTSITAKDFENFVYTDYALSADSEAVVNDWQKYQELAIQINYLKKADLSFFNGDLELLKTFIKELKAEIPEILKTNPIVSRVVVIENALLKLHDDLTLSNIAISDQLLSIRTVLVAFSNLNLQINKKLEFDIYNKIQPE